MTGVLMASNSSLTWILFLTCILRMRTAVRRGIESIKRAQLSSAHLASTTQVLRAAVCMLLLPLCINEMEPAAACRWRLLAEERTVAHEQVSEKVQPASTFI